MPLEDHTPAPDALDLACDNPHDTALCSGWASKRRGELHLCEYCFTFQQLLEQQATCANPRGLTTCSKVPAENVNGVWLCRMCRAVDTAVAGLGAEVMS